MKQNLWWIAAKRLLYQVIMITQHFWLNILIKLIIFISTGYDTIVAIYNGPNVKSVSYGHGHGKLSIKHAMPFEDDKEYKIVANLRAKH